MKKRLAKKWATLLFVKKNDPDCKCYERAQERHKMYYFRMFWHYLRIAKKRDWFWYYYYQHRYFVNCTYEEALKIAAKCNENYEEYKRKTK